MRTCTEDLSAGHGGFCKKPYPFLRRIQAEDPGPIQKCRGTEGRAGETPSLLSCSLRDPHTPLLHSKPCTGLPQTSLPSSKCHHPPTGLHCLSHSLPLTFSKSGTLPQFLSSSPQQAQVQETEEAGENSTLTPKVKSHRKKSNLRRAFSLKKHGSKDSKRTEASGTPGVASPEARPPKKHGFLPTCVSGHRASISGDPGKQA